jgi:hypothetical protein
MNFNNKSFFLNSFSQFNINGFFYKHSCYYYNLKNTFLLVLSFLDFVGLNRFFSEEASFFNNYTAGT